MSAAVKEEPTDDVPMNATSSSKLLDDDEIQAMDIDEEDEIIREIDVYISPELARTMTLVQFPLKPASHTVNPLIHHVKNSKSNESRFRPPPPPLPTSARMKPQHSMIELKYNLPSNTASGQRQLPEVLNLSERTFSSHQIPLKTHMALGLFDQTGNKIDLVPLHAIQQMRPTFQHVDDLLDDTTGEEEEELQKKKAEEEKTSKPVMFKKSENERAMMARKSSYAYKKASEEAEEWIELAVHGPGTDERKSVMKKAYCPRESREKSLRFMKAGKFGGSVGYVKSLNYLPSATADETVEDFTPTEQEEEIIMDDSMMNGNGHQHQPAWMKDLASKVSVLLQAQQGIPVSFPVIRSRFNSSVSDFALLQAISASAALVRGNFVLKSSLMALSPVVQKARDVILVLLRKHGFIQREKLIKAYENSGEEAVVITSEVINSLLDLIARKTLNGMEMKLDDDLTFENEFPPFAQMHALYWEKKEIELSKYVLLYEEQLI